MEIKQGQVAELWNGNFGEVLEVVGNKTHLLLEGTGKRYWEATSSIVATTDVYSEKEAKFLQAKDRLSAYKKKSEMTKQAPGHVDEYKWDESKKKVKKQTDKNYDDFTDRDWGLVTTIYKNMGGKFKSKKDSALTNDFNTKYPIGTILVPADGPDNTDQIHVLDINEDDKAYVLEKRPMAKKNPDEDSHTYGIRYEMPFNKLDSDNSLKLFASIDFSKGCPSNMVSIADNGDTIDVMFDNDLTATYTKEGVLKETNASEEQFSNEFKKDFGLMIKNIGVKKLSSILNQKRLAKKIAVLDTISSKKTAYKRVDYSGPDELAIVDVTPTMKFYVRPSENGFIAWVDDGRMRSEKLEFPTEDEAIQWYTEQYPEVMQKPYGKLVGSVKKTSDLYDAIDDILQIYRSGKRMDLEIFPNGAEAIKEKIGEDAYEQLRRMMAKYNREPSKRLGQEIADEYEFYASKIELGADDEVLSTNKKKAATKKDYEEASKKIEDVLIDIGAVQDDNQRWSVDTLAGPLSIRIDADSSSKVFTVFSKFDDPNAATKLGLDNNPYSGKWNFHGFDPLDTASNFINQLYSIINTNTGSKVSATNKTFNKRIASLKKKAARLGNYDFDVHEGATWNLEACDDGKQKIVRKK